MTGDSNPEKKIATLNTGQNDGANFSGAANEQLLGNEKNEMPIMGILGVIFGVLSIVSWAIIFVPLALIVGIISLFSGRIGWGVSAIILGVIGVITSPMIIMMLGLGAVLAYFGMPMPM